MTDSEPGETARINPLSAHSVRQFLNSNEFHPSRRLGQNFLVDSRYLARIVSASGISSDEYCLEIGPGLGALTGVLALNARAVIAVEIDYRLIEILQNSFGHHPHVQLVRDDFLKVDLDKLLAPLDGPVRVVANIPYSITSPLLEKLLEHKSRLSAIVLLVQREVADRLQASPGSKDYSSFTIYCSYHAEISVPLLVPRSAFVPVPKVDSSLIMLKPRASELTAEQEAMLFRVVRAAFQQRRKVLPNTLSDNLRLPKPEIVRALEAIGVSESERAEQLTLEQYKQLAAELG